MHQLTVPASPPSLSVATTVPMTEFSVVSSGTLSSYPEGIENTGLLSLLSKIVMETFAIASLNGGA